MRFVFFILAVILTSVPVLAAPGDKINVDSKSYDTPATKRQIRSNDSPVAPAGFKIERRVTNLGKISALAIANNDVFVADSAQDRILRLKSRTANSVFDIRAEYLIGFNQINDLVAANGELFISDKTGVWKINVGHMLVAQNSPELIYSHPTPHSKNTISMAILTDGKTLIIGNGNTIIALNPATKKHRQVSKGNWWVQDIAVSPTGSIWAAVTESGSSYILPIRTETEDVVRLALPPHAVATDIQFWKKDIFPENWPAEWASDLIFTLEGNHPMLARAHFNFGDITPEFTALVDGFSAPSRFVGRREYWGAPTALEIMPNGQLIFAEREQGSLWVMEKEVKPQEKPNALIEVPEIPETETIPDKKSIFPELLKGSSIESASGLETDDLLKAPKPEKDKEK